MIPVHVEVAKNTKNAVAKMHRNSKKLKKLEEILKQYGVALCYIFGSQKDIALKLLQGKRVPLIDRESDIDFAVVFKNLPENNLKTYALLSIELQEVVSPFRADLVFLHEVDHLIQFEAIKGYCVYCADEDFKEEYEEKVMKFASDEIEIFKLNEKDFFEAIENGYFQFEYKAD